VTESEARREILTLRQKELLQKADRVYVDVLALTDRGEVDAGPLATVVARRLKELGYTIVTDRQQPHDVVFRVKCEQRKVWEGTMASGGDADLPDSPSRVWKGPACQLTYLLRGKKTGWRKEVRTDFQDSIKAAAEAKADDAGAYALAKLKVKLEQYDFPVLVTADWRQTKRLLKVLDDPSTGETRKVKIIRVLGDTFAADAVPRLSAATEEKNLRVATAATLALGEIGKQESIPLLVALLRTGRPAQRPAAAKALGGVGALNFDYSVIPPLIEALETSDDVKVKTEAAWALGRLPDRRSIKPLLTLQDSLHTGMGPRVSPEIAELRKAVFWAWKQVEPSDQIN
jgi:hypothetical protein